MDKEIDDWLEQEYREFENQFLPFCRFWRAPAYMLQGTPFYELFEKFKEKFPDHPSDINTVFYLTESVDRIPVMHRVLIWCSHFEHAILEDLRNLVSFMGDAVRVLSTTEDGGGVELLDNIREKVVLEFYTPPERVIELLKHRGVRGGRE